MVKSAGATNMGKLEIPGLLSEMETLIQENVKPESYVVEDEVFEATAFDSEVLREEDCTSRSTSAILSNEERMQREIERQISWRLVKELKTVLVTKATEWKERERKALLRKAGLDISSLANLSPLTELPCTVGEWPLPRLKVGLPKKHRSNYASRRHSTVGFDWSHSLDKSNVDLNTGSEVDIVPPSQLNYSQPTPSKLVPPPPPPLPPPSSLEKVSPLSELPCSVGEWPLPRLKMGLPKKYESNYSKRRHSTLGFDCTHSLAESNVDLTGTVASLPHFQCYLQRSTLSSLPPPPPPPPTTTTTLVLPLSLQPEFLPPTKQHCSTPEHTLCEVGESVSEKESKPELGNVFKGAEDFWACRKKPIEDTFCGTGENLEEEISELCGDEEIIT